MSGGSIVWDGSVVELVLPDDGGLVLSNVTFARHPPLSSTLVHCHLSRYAQRLLEFLPPPDKLAPPNEVLDPF